MFLAAIRDAGGAGRSSPSDVDDNQWMKKKIAFKSSVDIMPASLNMKRSSYPIPEELKMAIELDKNDVRLQDPLQHYTEILPYLRDFKDIKEHHYWFVMKLLIYLDHYQGMADTAKYCLHKKRLQNSKFYTNSLVIQVPGLAEDRPSVRARDTVIVKQNGGKNYGEGTVCFVGEKYLAVKMDDGFLCNFSEEQEYDIFFLFPDYVLNCMHYAVDRANKFNLLPVLFPTGRPSEKFQPNEHLNWLNDNVSCNPEQQQAVMQIVARSAFPAPYILFGPPGTGKTSTLVEAICQILKKSNRERILVCTPSNAAADEIALRLLKYIEGRDMHRMYSISRDSRDVSDLIRPYSNFADDKPLYISKEILASKKVVITTLVSCHRLITYKLRENHFSYVFIDEAGQATEPETLIPMTLMSSKHESHRGRVHGQLVIAGDPKQLGPSVMSRLAEPLLTRSMLERLMDWDIYLKNKRNCFNPTYVTKLVQNYRCHQAILSVPNNLFYEGELKACGGEHTKRAIGWEKLPNPNFPLIFHAVDGQEGRESKSPSVFNATEVAVVIAYVRELLYSNLGGRKVLQSEIGIVTPYRLQRQKIHEELKRNHWSDVSVGTVETFQGQEKDIIIMSSVRSVLYRHEGKIHIGFLSNPKRFNVAVTRAKALLIVVGNPTVLQVDPNWRALIKHCIANRACAGVEFKNGFLNREEMQSLMAKKHIHTTESDSDESFEIVEVEPVPQKEMKLPTKKAGRRRRMPRYPANATPGSSDSELFFGSDGAARFSPTDLINGEYSDFEIDEDDMEMMEHFSNQVFPEYNSVIADSAVADSAPEPLDDSWEFVDSSLTINELAELMGNLK